MRYTFSRHCNLYINHWKFQGNRSFGVALTSIQTFYEVRSLDVAWWPDLAWPGSEIFKYMWKKCIIRCAKNGKNGFLATWKKWGSIKTPPTGRRSTCTLLGGGGRGSEHPLLCSQISNKMLALLRRFWHTLSSICTCRLHFRLRSLKVRSPGPGKRLHLRKLAMHAIATPRDGSF